MILLASERFTAMAVFLDNLCGRQSLLFCYIRTINAAVYLYRLQEDLVVFTEKGDWAIFRRLVFGLLDYISEDIAMIFGD
jgi:hypothetical protein